MKWMNMSQQIENILLNMKQTSQEKRSDFTEVDLSSDLEETSEFLKWNGDIQATNPKFHSLQRSGCWRILAHACTRRWWRISSLHGSITVYRGNLSGCNLNQHALPLKLPALVSSQQNASGDSTKWEVYQRVGALRHGPLQCSLDEANMSLGKGLNCWVWFFFGRGDTWLCRFFLLFVDLQLKLVCTRQTFSGQGV